MRSEATALDWLQSTATKTRTSYFSSLNVVSRAFSALCVYSKSGHHHHHPLAYLCSKFRFFRGLHCWASPSRKVVYPCTHSITQPAYSMPREPKLSLRNKMITNNYTTMKPRRECSRCRLMCWDCQNFVKQTYHINTAEWVRVWRLKSDEHANCLAHK